MEIKCIITPNVISVLLKVGFIAFCNQTRHLEIYFSRGLDLGLCARRMLSYAVTSKNKPRFRFSSFCAKMFGDSSPENTEQENNGTTLPNICLEASSMALYGVPHDKTCRLKFSFLVNNHTDDKWANIQHNRQWSPNNLYADGRRWVGAELIKGR